MAIGSQEIAILLKAQDAASPVVSALSNNLKSLDTAGTSAAAGFQRVSTAAAAAATAIGTIAVGGVSAALGAAVTSAMSFERQMSAVSAVSGASAGEMAQLSAAALQLGKDTSFSATEAGKGIEELIKAGVSVGDALGGGAKAALDLAAAGAISVGDAAEIAANAMNVFGKSGADMGAVADQIAGAANASAISVNDYKFSLSAAGAVAATVGIGFEDLTTAIAAMGNAGIKGSDAGTSLKTFLMNLSPSSKAATAAMRELGIITADGANQFFTAEGKAKSFAEIAQVLQDATRGLTEEQKLQALQTMFGSDAIRAAAVIAKEGSSGFEELAAAIGKVTAGQVADERLNNLSGSLEKLKGSLETAAITVGLMLTPALKTLVDEATTYVNQGIAVLEQLPDAWRTIGQVFAGEWEPSAAIHPFTNAVGEAAMAVRDTLMPAVQAVAPIFQAAFSWIVENAGAIKGAILGAAAAIGAIVAYSSAVSIITAIGAAFAAIMSPVGLFIAAAALLGAAWAANLGDVQGKAQAFFGIVGPAFQQLAGIVQQALSGDVAGAFEAFKTLVSDTGAQLAPLLAAWGAEFLTWIAEAGPPMLEAAAQLGLSLLAWIAAQLGPLASALLTWATAFVAWVTPMIPQALTALGGLIAAVGSWITTNGPVILAALAAWALAFVGWVAPAIPPLLAALGGLLTSLAGWIASTALPAIVAALVAWGTAFWEWVAPAIPLLVAELGKLLTGLTTWATGTALPAIVQQLTAWGREFSVWVGPASIAMMEALGRLLADLLAWQTKAVADIVKGLAAWAAEFGKFGDVAWKEMAVGLAAFVVNLDTWFRTLPAKFVAWGAEAIKAFIRGFLSVPIPMPSFGGGGGGGASSVSGGGSAHVAPHIPLINQVSAETGVPADVLAALMEVEGSGATAVSPAGARGLMQVVPGQGYDLPGEDWRDPLTSIRQGARAVADKYRATGSWQAAGRAYFGYGVDVGGMDTGTYGARYDAARQRYQQGGMTPRIPLSGGWTGMQPPMGAGAGEWDMWGAVPQSLQEIFTIAPQALAAYTEMTQGVIQQSDQMGTQSLTSVTNLGNGILTTFTDSAGTTIATVTDLNGNVTAQYATMANGVQLSMGDMSAGTLTSVTQMGDGVVTTMQDTAGNAISTVTDLAGNVTSQYVTMAGGASGAAQQMQADVTAATATMASQSLRSVTDLGDGIMTSIVDTAGNTVVTVTDMKGNVVSQIAQMADGTSLQMGSMERETLTSVTDLGDGVLTTVQDMQGNVVATVTDMSGNVVSQHVQMGSNSTGAAQAMASDVVEAIGSMASDGADNFGELMSAADDTVTALEAVGDVEIPAPDIDDFLDAMDEIQDAAEDALDAIKDINQASKGGSESSPELGKRADVADISRARGVGLDDRAAQDIVAVLERVESAISQARRIDFTVNTAAPYEPIAEDIAMLEGLARSRR